MASGQSGRALGAVLEKAAKAHTHSRDFLQGLSVTAFAQRAETPSPERTLRGRCGGAGGRGPWRPPLDGCCQEELRLSCPVGPTEARGGLKVRVHCVPRSGRSRAGPELTRHNELQVVTSELHEMRKVHCDRLLGLGSLSLGLRCFQSFPRNASERVDALPTPAPRGSRSFTGKAWTQDPSLSGPWWPGLPPGVLLVLADTPGPCGGHAASCPRRSSDTWERPRAGTQAPRAALLVGRRVCG